MVKQGWCNPQVDGLASFFFFNDPATPQIYTLSLHDALPISVPFPPAFSSHGTTMSSGSSPSSSASSSRSEEHTSELQSRFDLVCRLLLEKKNPSPASSSSPPHKPQSRRRPPNLPTSAPTPST